MTGERGKITIISSKIFSNANANASDEDLSIVSSDVKTRSQSQVNCISDNNIYSNNYQLHIGIIPCCPVAN